MHCVPIGYDALNPSFHHSTPYQEKMLEGVRINDCGAFEISNAPHDVTYEYLTQQ